MHSGCGIALDLEEVMQVDRSRREILSRKLEGIQKEFISIYGAIRVRECTKPRRDKTHGQISYREIETRELEGSFYGRGSVEVIGRHFSGRSGRSKEVSEHLRRDPGAGIPWNRKETSSADRLCSQIK